MGCTASKLDNEDTVRRCKERRRLMKEAVYARHHLVAAHSEYLRALRLTGSALVDFASGEPLSVSDQTPAILLRNPSSSFRATTPLPSQPPPPPQRYYSLSSPTIASSKLPHILSESSTPMSQQHKPRNNNNDNFYSNSTYASTPSQDSSVWNWENFYPPSPPNSDFFRHLPRTKEKDDGTSFDQTSHHFFRPPNGGKSVDGTSLHSDHHHLHPDLETQDREEVQCSEWGDHYSSTTESDDESRTNHSRNVVDDDIDRESRSELGSRSNFGSSVHHEDETSTSKSKFPPVPPIRTTNWNAGATTTSTTDEISSDMKMVIRHQDLPEMATTIKDYFDKAASAGDSVSDLLEIGRAQLDRSFRQLKRKLFITQTVCLVQSAQVGLQSLRWLSSTGWTPVH